MTTYSELVTQIKEYCEVDSNVFTTAIVNDFIEHAESKIFRPVSYTHLTLPTTPYV